MDEMKETLEAVNMFLNDESVYHSILDSIFSSLDSDGSGALEYNEIAEFIKEINAELKFTDEANGQLVQQIFNDMDKDKSKSIDKNELGTFLISLFKKQKEAVERSMRNK